MMYTRTLNMDSYYIQPDPDPCRCENECQCQDDEGNTPIAYDTWYDGNFTQDVVIYPNGDIGVCRCDYACVCTAEDFEPDYDDYDD